MVFLVITYQFNWEYRDRTCAFRGQNAVPYHLGEFPVRLVSKRAEMLTSKYKG